MGYSAARRFFRRTFRGSSGESSQMPASVQMQGLTRRRLQSSVAILCFVCLLASCDQGHLATVPATVGVPTVIATPAATRAGTVPLGSTMGSGVSSPVEPTSDDTMRDLEACILRHWIHSHEEDTPGLRVYRPADYNFPRSRGRVGFEFREGGQLVYYGIARADGSEVSPGRWTIEGPNRIAIEVENERIQPFILEVLSCDAETLKVKR